MNREFKEVLLDSVRSLLAQIESVEFGSDSHATDIRFLEIKIRRVREKIFPEGYFSDVAWDILLELDKAYEKKETVYVTDLGIDSKIPLTTILRYLGRMEKDGLVERFPDSSDKRRTIVSLTEAGASKMLSVFNISI